MMNRIAIEQNDGRQINRLAAQRQLYSQAKRVFAVHAILSGPVAVLTAFIVIVAPSAKSYVALWGLAVVLLDIFVFTPWQKRLKTSAARIQEAFDTDVLELPWNSLKTGSRPDAELVKEMADKYQKVAAAKASPLTNWYSPAASEIPLYMGRVACQRANCWWDAKQRRRYASCVVGGVVFVFALVLASAMAEGLTIENFFLKVLTPLSPALLLGIRQCIDHMEAAERLDRLKDHASKVWANAVGGKSDSEVSSESRNLQDEIFENRRKSPLVFDWVFERFRTEFETQMNHGVEESVADAKIKLGLT